MAFNLSAFAGAGAQFFDSNGTPLVGGLLYVYTAGTTTPATTWTTNAGTVANTNPIVLNAAGRTPFEIWLNSGATYKFALYTSTNVLIGTYDNIPAIDDPTSFNNLITVTGTNTLLGSSTPPITAYAAGMTLSFVVVNTNTGPVTIDVSGLGAKEITFSGSTPLIAGQMTAGAIVTIQYDGTRFQLMNSSGALAITASSINGGQIAGFRNKIINGAFRIAQRGTSSNTAGYSSLDRWFLSGTGVVCTLSQQTATVAGVSANVMQYAGVAGNTAGSIRQRIESVNCYDLVGKSVTIGFYVYQNTGSAYSFQTGLSYADAADNFSAVTAITSNTTSIPNATWTYVSFATSALPANAANGLQLQFFNNSPALISGLFQFAFFQLEQGVIATPFEQRLYGTELMLCQRYYEVLTTSSLFSGFAAYCANTTTARGAIQFKVTKRASPTVAMPTLASTNINSQPGNFIPTSVSFESDTNSVGFDLIVSSAPFTAGQGCSVGITGTGITLSAEL
jgi:hypothetical protein